MLVMAEDERRARELAELAILGTTLDPLFERICGTACAVFDVPMAYVSLIDTTHQHLVARHGLDLECSMREDAICDLTIRDDRPLVIEDARVEPRLMHNKFVLGPPFLRFYAGIPLSLTPGLRIGSFCLADVAPRTLSAKDLAILEGLAAMVVAQIRHHASQRELANKTLALSDKQAILSQVEQLAVIGGFEANPATGNMRCSDQIGRILPFTPECIDDFIAVFEEGARREIGRGFARIAFGDHTFDVETTLVSSGSLRHVRIFAAGSGAASERRLVGIVQDVTERKRAVELLEWTSSHDTLTRLLNRKGFNDHLDRIVERARAGRLNVALFMIDLDKFKLVNDTLGHDAGDAVLIGVSERLTHVVGSSGIVARIGGDEFGILLEDYENEGHVGELATSVLKELRASLLYRNRDLGVRASIGVALWTRDTRGGLDFFKDADIALYTVKAAGRDGFAFYDPTMRQQIEARVHLIAKARGAVFAGRIEPYYQPKICLETGRIGGFEALVRWQDAENGLSTPGEMGDAFNDAEFAIALGRGMLERVTHDMVGWKRDGVAFNQIAINAAEPEFFAGRYAEQLLDRLAACGLANRELEVEVTESVFLGQATGVVARTLQRLSDAGISIALDDFGTGFASLTHLKQYPVSAIKIDRSFVMDLETSRSGATIVDAVTSLARSLKMTVVAEGIETRYQLDFLRARACTMGQGYFFARPMPAAEVPEFVRAWPDRARPTLLLATG